MSARTVRYYDYEENEELTCPRCGWNGTAKEGDTESYGELFDVSCPKCDQKLLIVSYPTRDETEEAAKGGNKQALEELSFLSSRHEFLESFERDRLRSPQQLPELEGEALSFVWDQEEDRTVIRIGDKVIWSEPAIYEGWERFNEVKNFLKQKYGPRFRRMTPTMESKLYLYGDDISSPGKISVD
ncbi:MAG: hypothetical protein AVDCRST_MAG93-6787 [uncultured Chloroflexia bacterium]|uniref:Uncharacterized protein n=1 Tax=uncultured Chloroflexia bacterium TaxID=1672391 RepID=A0A6J4LXY9_9CHLR|nr:MAG: hypothetical protein AVDCRST_MAG93-6787 [uncultured Chloroflexia bacterium]